MICPVCGIDLQDEKVCECGWKEAEEVAQEENFEEVTESLEQQELELEEVQVNETDFGSEDVLEECLEKNGLDFNVIQENNEKIVRVVKNKRTPWGVAIVSFICGILTTLIVIGSLNGMIVKSFDRVMYGSPKTSVNTFFKCVYETQDAKAFLKIISPYQRELVKSSAAQFVAYGYIDYFEFNENVDVTNDTEFLPYANAYLSYFSNSGYDIKIANFAVDDVVYYNNASDTYKIYSEDYKPQTTENSNVQLYADVDVTIDISISSNGMNEDGQEQYKVVCAKIDGVWKIVHVGSAEE